MSDTSKRGWGFYIGDMIDFAEKVLSYTEGLDQSGFAANKLVYDATLRNLELIGEAATHIPEAIRNAHDEIPWPPRRAASHIAIYYFNNILVAR